MNEYIKNSYKKIFTIFLMILSCFVIKSEHHEVEPKRNLTVIYNEIAALGTPEDVSGLYNLLTTLIANDTTIIAKLCTLLVNDEIIINKLCELLAGDVAILHKLCEILVNDAEIMCKLCEIISNDNVILHKLCELLSNDTAMAAQLCILIANDATIMHELCEILVNDTAILHKLCEIAASDSVIMYKLCELLSNDSVMLHKLCELLTNDAVILNKLCIILANTNTIMTDLDVISSNIVNLGNPSDVSNLYNLLSLIIFNLQLDPVFQVTDAISNISLQTPVTSADPNLIAIIGLAGYQTNLAAALSAAIIAITPTTETPANTQLAIDAINLAISSFNALAIQWNIDGYYAPTSPYSVAQIMNALAQLKSTLIYLLAQQPA